MLPGSHDGDTLVYSSDPAHRSNAPVNAPRPVRATGDVRIWLEKKGRNGKPVSIVRGLTLDGRALASLASRLKRTCGSGGSAKDGEIIIQGDHRDTIADILTREGFRVKNAGG